MTKKHSVTIEQFKESLNNVAATSDGKVLLACIREYCNFAGDILVEKDMESTYANATLRRVYVWLRGHIADEYLKEIEFNYKREVANNGQYAKLVSRTGRADNSRADKSKSGGRQKSK